MEYHITKTGKKIKLVDLEIDHLLNIIKYIERKAEEGFTVSFGGGYGAEDIWYDEKTYYDEQAKKYLHYKAYVDELKRRRGFDNEEENGKV